MSSLVLHVAEALAKDVGRGIVRLDPKDMATLGVQVGDYLRVVGKRATVAKAMPAYPGERGRSLLLMDGIVRANAQTGLADQVEVQRATCTPARAVVLAPLGSPGGSGRAGDPRHLARLLEGLPVTPGDRVRATYLGSRYQEFTVVRADPGGPVVIGAPTALRLQGEGGGSGARTGVTYEDVGGLRKEIHRIREMIELPLKHPELFQRLGIEPPKGVLLHGPPGCGKTLIARAVAHETSAYFTHLSGPEIMGRYYGESEARLRGVFEEAQAHAPAILFIDEVDAIAPKRQEIRGDQQVERRVVAQLLALMDGLESRGQVVVIAATNVPDMLDPALRRPGRFDREIVIGVPDRPGRVEVLEIHTRGMPLAADVDLARLAEITHGFVGADLAALCREAAMATLRRAMPQVSLDFAHIPDEVLARLEVGMPDFLEALREVEPSALREVFTEVPRVGWDEVGGLEPVKQALREAIEWPLRYPDLFQRAGTAPPRGVLLAGAPGTGKTLLAKAVAGESQANFISIKGPELLSKWVGESEGAVREIFKKARLASPCIVFFDEIEALAPRRGTGDSQTTERVMAQLLAEMDGIEELRGVLVLAATNRPDLLDPALLRAGRLELQLVLPLPDEAARREVLQIHTRAKPLAADVDLGDLARLTEGLAGADIEALCRRAALAALRELLAEHGPDPAAAETVRLAIGARHFQEALQALPSAGAPRR